MVCSRSVLGALALGFTLFSSPALALDQGCFNYRAEKPKPLRAPLPLIPNKTNAAFGELDHGVGWGAARAVINKPIQYVLDKFLDHRVVKDMSKTKLTVESEVVPGYLALHKVNLNVDVASFITIRWKEEWAYILEEGTAKAPKRMHLYYQKIDGSRHIQHLCGEFILVARDANSTDVYLYEQLRATRRSADATMRMHQSTLDKLRTGKYETPSAAPVATSNDSKSGS